MALAPRLLGIYYYLVGGRKGKFVKHHGEKSFPNIEEISQTPELEICSYLVVSICQGSEEGSLRT
jgi:hypothetical protein